MTNYSEVTILKKILIAFILILFITGCSSFVQKPEPDHVTSSILENNKEDLTLIKNKTADDIELGYKVRTLGKKQMTDEEFGIKIREILMKQEGSHNSQIAIDIRNRTSEINNRLNSIILIVVIVVLIVAISNVLIVLRMRRNERMGSKFISKMGNRITDD